MKNNVVMETVDVTKTGNNSYELCKGEIEGTRPIHHTIKKGSKLIFEANTGYYHIVILIQGKALFETNGKSVCFNERVTIVPAPDKEMLVSAETDVQILEIQWDIAGEDIKLLEEYKTQFPVIQEYESSIQYVDPNKSEKTISRMMIPHRVIPRFAIGSVESYGYDYVKPHAHPMLDQFFFSFPENDMNVLINGEPIPMLGNIIIHIPLGADHGVEVAEGKHMHYMWIDFLPDNDKGLQRLDERHKPTGTLRDLEKEDKFRKVD